MVVSPGMRNFPAIYIPTQYSCSLIASFIIVGQFSSILMNAKKIFLFATENCVIYNVNIARNIKT